MRIAADVPAVEEFVFDARVEEFAVDTPIEQGLNRHLKGIGIEAVDQVHQHLLCAARAEVMNEEEHPFHADSFRSLRLCRKR